MGYKQVVNDEEMRGTVVDGLNELATNICDEGIDDRCLNCNGDYI
jgi:hypothetical protein